MTGSCRRYCAAAVAALLLGGCASQPLPPAEQPESYQFGRETSARVGDQVARTATALVGSPYRYGARGPDSFDCSGLVHYAYASAGFQVPRTSAQQYRAARPVGLADARAGDLLFSSYEDKVSHVGIYLGNQRFVHAPSTGKHVNVASLESAHYQRHFVRAGRLPLSQ